MKKSNLEEYGTGTPIYKALEDFPETIEIEGYRFYRANTTSTTANTKMLSVEYIPADRRFYMDAAGHLIED